MSDELTHYVYTAYDTALRPLYVGCSHDVAKRLVSHRGDGSEWVQYLDGFTVDGPFTHEEALRRERERIVRIRPHFNWQPEHATALKAWNRRGNPETLSFYAKYGAEVTRTGRHKLYRELVRRPVRSAA